LANVTEIAAEEAVHDQAETNAGVARATGVLALGNIASRVLGLMREIVITHLFGATEAAAALRVAVAIPIIFYDLLIGGHVNGAVIPVLSGIAAREGETALWRLVSVLFSLVTVALSLLVLVIELIAPQVIQVAGGAGFDDSTAALAAALLRLTAPALIFMSLFAVLSGTLYALRRFTLPAFAGVVFNGSIVLVTLLFVPPPVITTSFQNGLIHWTAARPENAITAAAFGWLVGALAQVLLQLPGLQGAKLRFTVRWNHPALRQMAWLYAPVMFSLVMDTLVIRPFSYNLATQTGDSNLNYMALATTLIQFPQGLVAVATSIAILPTLSRQAALIEQNEDNSRAFKDTLGLGLRLTITLIVPAAVGLFVLATPIIALLFQHGVFTAGDTAITVIALRLYLIGLPFAALDLLLVYAFYARQDTLTPAVIGLISLVIYMGVAIVLIAPMGLFSLMIADSVKHIVHAVLSAALLWRRMRGLGDQRLMLTLGKTGLAALAMGAVALLVTPALTAIFPAHLLPQEVLLVAISGGLSAAVFLGMAVVLRIEELRWLFRLVQNRFVR
jgi:putative peptidoglycan lipid II flippase